MAITVKKLIPSKQAEAAETTQYTAVNASAVIDKFTGTNTSGGAVTLIVHIVPFGGTAGVSNQISSTKSLAANEVYTFPELVGQVLASGEFISTIASAATSITIRASGREIT